MTKKQAIKVLKSTGYIGNEVGVAFDVAMKSMKKLGEIEQILKARSYTDDVGNACYLDDSERIGRIKEVLESEKILGQGIYSVETAIVSK